MALLSVTAIEPQGSVPALNACGGYEMQRISRKCSSHVSAVVAGLMCLQAGCTDGILTCQPDADDPFQGRWSEGSFISCDDGSESPGSIGEIIFCQGRFSVTRTPFETFIDYMGDYQLNRDANELTMTVTGGNFIPDDVDLTGTVEFEDDGSIVLRDIYLGSFDSDSNSSENGGDAPTVACGHILEP